MPRSSRSVLAAAIAYATTSAVLAQGEPSFVGDWAMEGTQCGDNITFTPTSVEDQYDLYCEWTGIATTDDKTYAVDTFCDANPGNVANLQTFSFVLSDDLDELRWIGGPDFGTGPMSTWKRC